MSTRAQQQEKSRLSLNLSFFDVGPCSVVPLIDKTTVLLSEDTNTCPLKPSASSSQPIGKLLKLLFSSYHRDTKVGHTVFHMSSKSYQLLCPGNAYAFPVIFASSRRVSLSSMSGPSISTLFQLTVEPSRIGARARFVVLVGRYTVIGRVFRTAMLDFLLPLFCVSKCMPFWVARVAWSLCKVKVNVPGPR